MESSGLVECDMVTSNLMVSDQAGAGAGAGVSDGTLVFSGAGAGVRVRNRVTSRLRAERRTEIQLELRTQDTEAEILSVGGAGEDGDMFSLGLEAGHLVVRLRLGAARGEARSEVRLSDGRWRRVGVERAGGRVLVRVDTSRDIFSLDLGTGEDKLRSGGEYRLGRGLEGELRNLRIKKRLVTRASLLL